MDETTVSIIFNLLAAEVGDEKMKAIIKRRYIDANLTPAPEPTAAALAGNVTVLTVMSQFKQLEEDSQGKVIDKIYEDFTDVMTGWMRNCEDYIAKDDILDHVSLSTRGDGSASVEVTIEVDD